MDFNKKILIALLISFIVFSSKKNKLVGTSNLLEIVEKTAGDIEEGFYPQSFENELKKLGWQKGQDWCAYFVKYYILSKITDKNKRDILNKYLSGSSQQNYKNLLMLSDKYSWVKKYSYPIDNSIITWQKIDDQTKGHQGIIIDASNYKTLEGNSFNKLKGKDGVNILTRKNFEVSKNLKLLNYFFVIQ